MLISKKDLIGICNQHKESNFLSVECKFIIEQLVIPEEMFYLDERDEEYILPILKLYLYDKDVKIKIAFDIPTEGILYRKLLKSKK